MRCREARRRFGRRLDARLPDPERAALDGHVSGCAGCAAELARWEAAAAALRGLGPTPVPPHLAERAWHAAMEADAAPTLAAWFIGSAPRAALAGAVAAAAVWLGVAGTRGPERTDAVAAAQDPIDAAVAIWIAEGLDDGR
jgi:anti-sigma factor RsiW